ncbi:hypothetical protein pb186bvf_017335 [Paramecium bursaria]
MKQNIKLNKSPTQTSFKSQQVIQTKSSKASDIIQFAHEYDKLQKENQQLRIKIETLEVQISLLTKDIKDKPLVTQLMTQIDILWNKLQREKERTKKCQNDALQAFEQAQIAQETINNLKFQLNSRSPYFNDDSILREELQELQEKFNQVHFENMQLKQQREPEMSLMDQIRYEEKEQSYIMLINQLNNQIEILRQQLHIEQKDYKTQLQEIQAHLHDCKCQDQDKTRLSEENKDQIIMNLQEEIFELKNELNKEKMMKC